MSKIIALDAGHGLKTAGKRCMKALDQDQTREWWLNDRIMDKVETSLRDNYDCTVLRVDDTTGAKDISLSARVKAANNANADAYVSMHHNAGLKGRTGGGTVVFYCSSKPERSVQSHELYNMLVRYTGLIGNRAEKVIYKKFYVIKNTKMPAFLVENGFMDSPTDVPIILSEAHAVKTAQGVVSFLVKELKLEPKKVSVSAPQKPTEAYYPAYKGAKTTLYNALVSLGVDGSYKHRKLIAKANGIIGYVGTATQNTRMYNLLVAGILKKA